MEERSMRHKLVLWFLLLLSGFLIGFIRKCQSKHMVE